jgi:hypothetical protein
MANALNTFSCALFGANTGFGSCTLDFKNITGAIIVPQGTSFTQANTLTPAAFLTALITATSAVKASRAYPINGFGEIKDGSESAVTEKLGYGSELVVRDGNYKWAFRIEKGGFCLSKALRQFNNMNVDVFFVDASGLVIGQRNVSSTGTVSFGGIPQYQAYQEPLKINDGSKNTIYMQNFSFAGNAFDNFGGVQLSPGDFSNVLGLQNITFTSATRTTNVSVVKGVAGCVGADLGDTLGTALNVATLWRLQDSVTGTYFNASTGITSVAYSSTTNAYTITANASDPAYNAGNPVNVSLAAASVLDAAGLHYESNVIVTST